MRNKSYSVLLIVLTAYVQIVAAQEAPELAFFTKIERNSLAGLSGVNVTVTPIAADIERQYLRANQIKTDSELRLRRDGIQVLSQAEAGRAPGMPCLSIDVSILVTMQSNQPIGLTYKIDVSLMQTVYLHRDPQKITYAPTWSRSHFGNTPLDNGGKIIRDITCDIVNQFINDYLAMNPPKKANVQIPEMKATTPVETPKSKND